MKLILQFYVGQRNSKLVNKLYIVSTIKVLSIRPKLRSGATEDTTVVFDETVFT